MRYRTKSADVLNEADRFQRILDWQLFCMEQDTALWGYDPNIKWVPGHPIYPHPNSVSDGCDCCDWDSDDDSDVPSGYGGNHIRPMFELMPDDKNYRFARCEVCQVSWQGDDPCWICGRICKSYSKISYAPEMFIGSSQALALAGDSIYQGIYENMQRRLDELLWAAPRQLSLPEYRASRSRPNFDTALARTIYDEASLIEPYLPPSSGYIANPSRLPFEQPEVVGPLWGAAALYDPTKPKSWTVLRPLRYVDLTAKRGPVLPRMLKQESIRSRDNRNPTSTPITKQRRRRNL